MKFLNFSKWIFKTDFKSLFQSSSLKKFNETLKSMSRVKMRSNGDLGGSKKKSRFMALTKVFTWCWNQTQERRKIVCWNFPLSLFSGETINHIFLHPLEKKVTENGNRTTEKNSGEKNVFRRKSEIHRPLIFIDGILIDHTERRKKRQRRKPESGKIRHRLLVLRL